MLRAAVIGDPIKHSLSPMLFSMLSRAEQVALEYDAIRVRPEELPSFLSSIKGDANFVGCNVTLPHKVSAIALVDEVSEEAAACGALNVIHHRAGKLMGHNTDVIGIRECLKDVPRGHAILYGAGGAARAAAYVLGSERFPSVTLVNRSDDRAKKLIDDFSRLFPETRFTTSSPGPASLLLNATSIGLNDGDPQISVPANLAPNAVAFDFVYGAKPTPFLNLCAQRGLHTIDGKRLLLAQALATWNLFFGPRKGDACFDF